MFKHGLWATLFLVLVACSPSQVQLTPTPEITQTNTLTPTQTKTPEPTVTPTMTPSPTATATVIIFPAWTEIRDEFQANCKPVPDISHPGAQVDWIAERLAGRDVNIFSSSGWGGDKNRYLSTFSPGRYYCLLVVWSEDPAITGFGYFNESMWGRWPVASAVAGYYNGSEVVKYYYFSQNQFSTLSP